MATDKDDLTDRLLKGTLTERETEEVRQLIRTDGAFRDRLSFDLAFAEAVERLEMEQRAGRYTRRAKRARIGRIALIAGIILLTIAALVTLLIWHYGKEEPFSDTEAYALLRAAIEEGEAGRELGTSAGTTDWQDLLLTKGGGEESYRAALAALRSERQRTGDCRFPTNDFYEGLLELYLNRNYAAAEARLECELRLSGGQPDYGSLRTDRLRALLLTKIGLGKFAEAAAILESDSGLQLPDLPPGSRRQLESYLADSPER